ncbi:MAG: class I SAM-dependent methyltransferase [Alphaproteobacteria bacterium]
MIRIVIALYIVVQTLLLPLAILGLLWISYKQLWVSRKLGVSQTMIEAFNGRWTMAAFGLYHDPAASRLARVLPNNSVFGMWLILFPLFLLHKVTGRHLIYPRRPDPGTETIADLITVRTFAFDRLIEKHRDGAAQIVLLGAGLDTRAYGGLADSGLVPFELDQPAEQGIKRRALARARIDSDHVRFVEVNFGDGSWVQNLMDAGFDPSARTIFLWEGVTLYLSEWDVRDTLTAIGSLAVPGSVILADFYGARLLERVGRGTTKKMLEATGEKMGFGLDFATAPDNALSAFVASASFDLGERRFIGGAGGKGPFAVVTELLVPEASTHALGPDARGTQASGV